MKRSARNVVSISILGAFVAAALLAAMTAASSAEASVLNVAWRGDGYTTRIDYTGLGAATDAAANTVWNNLDTASGGTSTISSLVYSNGAAATGVSIQLNGANCFTPGGSPTLALFNGQLNGPNSATNASIDVQGLSTATTYDVYLYSARAAFSAESTTFTINGNSQTLPGSNNTSEFVLGDNYCKFSGVPAAGGTINIAFGGGAYGGDFSAMQIVGVPEPGTLALAVAGAFALIAYAWRKRSL